MEDDAVVCSYKRSCLFRACVQAKGRVSARLQIESLLAADAGRCDPCGLASCKCWFIWKMQRRFICVCASVLKRYVCLPAGGFFFYFFKPHAQTCTGKQTPGTLGGKSLQNQANRWISILKCIFEYAVIFSNHLLSVRSRFSFTVVVKTGRRRRNLSALIQNGNHRIWLKRSSKH